MHWFHGGTFGNDDCLYRRMPLLFLILGLGVLPCRKQGSSGMVGMHSMRIRGQPAPARVKDNTIQVVLCHSTAAITMTTM